MLDTQVISYFNHFCIILKIFTCIFSFFSLFFLNNVIFIWLNARKFIIKIEKHLLNSLLDFLFSLGLSGLDGLPGLKGDRGLPGFVGLRGERGEIGAQGDVGWHGVDGVDGPKGYKGKNKITSFSIITLWLISVQYFISK